jgi:redox-sensitive bicupin YhaK (pirin superfamily)
MLEVRRADEIYEKEGGWFNARWHFSFDEYRDPEYDNIGPLRVFNDDRLIAGAIWPMHPHRDVEGLTYVVEGSFGHEDNVGGDYGPLPAGSVQRMTLGSGALHSEQNASEDQPMRFIQIWILPSEGGLEPGVEQKVFTTADRTNRLLEALSSEGGDAVKIHGDARVFISRLEAGNTVDHEFAEGRAGYLYAISGDVAVNGTSLTTGDAVTITDEPSISLTASEDTELIMVDVPTVYEPVGIWAR